MYDAPTSHTHMRDRISISLAGILLVSIFLFGGASRPDAFSQLLVRLISVAAFAVALSMMRFSSFQRIRATFALAICALSLVLLQLIPLPPAIWSSLPGREIVVEQMAILGLPQPWRPISLVPEATLNSALAFLPSLAFLAAISLLNLKNLNRVVLILAILIAVGAFLGIAQVVSLHSFLYFYDVTNEGNAVGLFANRNHQAAALSCLFPIAITVALYHHKRMSSATLIGAVACIDIILLPAIFATGSRAGLILAGSGIVAQFFLYRYSAQARASAVDYSSKHLKILVGAGVAGAAVVVAAAVILSRASAIERLYAKDIEADYRITLFGTMQEMMLTYFPLGSGYGSFSQVFRIHEPDWYLRLRYFNHAHNDVFQVVIEGGLAGALLLIIFAIWWVRKSWQLWRSGLGAGNDVLLGRLGTSITGILGLASLVDYPLRTPIGATIFLFGCGLMSIGGIQGNSARKASGVV